MYAASENQQVNSPCPRNLLECSLMGNKTFRDTMHAYRTVT